ncbi:MAG: recombinase RecQ [Flavobacteriales bacterium]|nr:recombinase RecQ [Flavobacteriales bacterium]|tara:strand:- start:12205 stop:13920 length:1716 start_codon:yes stop_codon:yes gene_type:complete
MNSLEILKKYWGYNKFRLHQEEIINNILKSKDTLAILPTGGGKTICYQIPALVNKGICIVISPLISIMQDQINYLNAKGFISHALTSNISLNETERILNNCIYGNVKFLYITPEKLKNVLLMDKITLMNINLIAVDEAHCISDWGHDFRPAYRNIAIIREKVENAPILALTATANKEVAKDIQENLLFKETNLIKGSLIRNNIAFKINQTNDKENQIIFLLNNIKSSVIIYVDTRKKTKEISDLLKKNNFSAEYYHAGLDYNKKKEVQNNWSKNQTRIIVATSAFGMGINKKDVKLIIHLFLPHTVEEYFQQAGRAGRNGEKAYAILLANQNDIIKQKKTFNLKYPDINEIKLTYENIASYFNVAINEKPNIALAFNLQEFCFRYKIEIIRLYNTIRHLEKNELLKINLESNIHSRVKMNVKHADLYKFQVINKQYDPIIQTLLRKHENIINEYSRINEKKIANELNISEEKVKDLLIRLDKLEILLYKKANSLPTISFLQPRLNIENIKLDYESYKRRKKIDYKNLSIMINYFNEDKKCRNKFILEYFNEKITKECGICDICINLKKQIK